jgi:DNA-binding SARP family transcriptional activator
VERLDVAVLGPVEVRRDGRPLDLGTPKQRALVAALALSGGRAVPVDTIVDLLWGDEPPGAVATTLQGYVAGLRKVLEPDRARRAPATVLVTEAPGYALRLGQGTDATRLDRVVNEQHRRLTGPLLEPSALSAAELVAAAASLDEVLGWWRGEPFAELGDADAAVAERAHLHELRLVALEDRATARLALGDHATTAAELESLTARHPLRERLWALRVLALTRSGRQAEALDALRQVRRLLDEELGIDPGVELRRLQDAVLRQDPVLGWRAPADSTSVAAPAPVPAEPATAPETRPETAPGTTRPVAPWPMLGRDAELRRLVAALEDARGGRARFSVVTGEPGIGKSRLCAELATLARTQGVRVATGRCSQDRDAPPLRPWETVLASLGEALPEMVEGGSDFHVWEEVGRRVRGATADGPVLVVLDDLHWADTATLRVLRLLAEAARDEPLLCVTTWRDEPAPTGMLAEVTETLARVHAERLELSGLDERAAAAVVDAVTRTRPTEDDAARLTERTDGNPFFLVEYARLASSRRNAPGLHELLAEPDPPTAVQEVLTRRVDRLPDETAQVLRVASVLGRRFDLGLLAAVSDVDEDDLLDLVEPAQTAGLVREDGAEGFAFGHALVRDTVYAGLRPTRRARLHARAAEALAGSPAHTTEEARHWLAAGPSRADRAWRAASAAAEVARRSHAHEEAADLLEAALRALGDDPAATDEDRYDLLMRLVVPYRWSARWEDLIGTVERAVELATGMGDVERTARAAIATTQGGLWQSAPEGEVHEGVVDALRRSAAELTADDDPAAAALRCRCLLGIALETYFVTPYDERRALVDEALGVAADLGDPALTMDAHQVAIMALRRGDPPEERLEHADVALDAARRARDEQGGLVSATLRAVALSELGRTQEMWLAVEVARAESRRLEIPYGELVVDNMVVPWLAMAGRYDEAETVLERMRGMVLRTGMDEAQEAVDTAQVGLDLWSGRADRAADAIEPMLASPYPMASTVATYRWRSGDTEAALALLAEHPVELAEESYLAPLDWANAACVALFTGDPVLGARSRDLLAPWSGSSCSIGSGMASGPIDVYLALATAAAGDRSGAATVADRALAQCDAWGVPVVGGWLRDLRTTHGF